LKKVLVTGACGYLGARISKYLAENGCRVTAFDSYNPTKYNEWTTLMETVIIGDIRDEATISNLTDNKFDVAINLISLDHRRCDNDPNFVSSINVMPTWNLLDNLTKNGLQKFIYFSTQQVLGELPPAVINESYLPNPTNRYGLTHLLCERIVDYYDKVTDTDCVNVRLSNGYGSPVFKENNCWWLVINDMCKTAFTKKEIKLASNGSPQRDFIHILDICRAIEILIGFEGSFDTNIFNIASGETVTIMELSHCVAEIYKDKYHLEIPIILPDKSISIDPNLYQYIKRYRIDTRGMTQLGFQPQIGLKEGLVELFEYLES